MKKFRSSKVLKPVEPQVKEEAHLRMKVRALEEQVQMLQKNNLNIFIPISEHPVAETTDFQAIINRLRQQVSSLQHQNQCSKQQIKKLEREKEEMRKEHLAKISELSSLNSSLQQRNAQILQELQESEQQLEEKKKECEQLDQLVIEKNVELKFLHEDLHEEKLKSASLKEKLLELQRKVIAVTNSSYVHRSLETRMICLEKDHYDKLLQEIAELKARIQSLLEANRREVVTLGARRNDVGEEIVRLKKNIDVQLGLTGNSLHSEQFLKAYRGTNELFKKLIDECHVSTVDAEIKG